ncbi:FHA domain-containing protein [bacterium]|nr:FHA domain-containing protein [bacterium]
MTRFIVEIERAGKPALRFAVPDDGLTFGGGPDADVALPAMGSSLITLRPESDDLRVAAIRPTQGDLPPRLGNGESCKIGALTMRLRVEKSPVREPTRELRLEPDKRAVQVRRLALEIKDDPARRPRAHQLLNGRTIVGGDPDCDVHVADPYVSARHLAIDAYDGQLIIHDLASTNGTFIDGERVDAAPVHVGQTITLGNTHLTVSAKEFLEQIPPPSRPFPALIGDAPVFLDVLAIAAKVAETGVTLLITGETGT